MAASAVREGNQRAISVIESRGRCATRIRLRGPHMGGRDDLREGEVRDIVHQEWAKLGEKLRDGAQASLNTALILTGDPRFGIKGALPEINERLTALESRMEHTEQVGDERHEQNSKRLDGLELGQGRIRKVLTRLWESITRDKDGKWDLVKVGAVAGGIGTAGRYIVMHFPTWFEVKKFVVQVMTQAGK